MTEPEVAQTTLIKSQKGPACSPKPAVNQHPIVHQKPEDSASHAILDSMSMEQVVEYKLIRFLDQLGSFYPENLRELMLAKVERPLIQQILRRVGGNQVQASKILGINRNTLRKKIRLYEI